MRPEASRGGLEAAAEPPTDDGEGHGNLSPVRDKLVLSGLDHRAHPAFEHVRSRPHKKEWRGAPDPTPYKKEGRGGPSRRARARTGPAGKAAAGAPGGGGAGVG